MLRYGEQLEILFHHKIEDQHIKIAPLILLSFVENAFKHGASGNPFNPKVHIDLTVENAQLYFEVFNTKSTTSSQIIENCDRNGIGTTNISRQLALNYPKKHNLQIEDTSTSYSVVLKIDLN